MMTIRNTTIAGIAALLLAGTAPIALAQTSDIQGEAYSMRDAIAVAMQSNPEINQAQMNKEAIQFERKQAQGLYAPRVDIEASAGVRRLENNTRRTLGIADQRLYPLEFQGTGSWTLIDFGRRRGELTRQASRVDGASLRVLERSEFIALQIARQYLDVLLQQRIYAASVDNTAFHQGLVRDLGTGVQQGSISIADQQQAQERLQAAIVRQTESEESLENAKITLRRLTGLDISQVQLPPDLSAQMPPSLDEAVGLARTNNPRVKEAEADVDAANALAKSAKGDLFPTIGVDMNGRIGDDIDGFRGETKDVQARVFMKWNIFDGKINQAKYQEMIRRASESRFRLHQVSREAEEDVRTAWNGLRSQSRITDELATQSKVSDDLLLSYRSQFNVGRRSLLDVLDAQNSRYSVQTRLETARFSKLFAQYQTLAATNRFLSSLQVAPGAGADAAERARFDYGPSKPAELQYRSTPK
ncbi:TolC family protein [Novosphingobium tardum]|uniref:TolC family protein n=1 Tax=Novosphingobium tardum TaxID=1538021 RepID=A0ABV8RUQ9_9SPHN